MCIRDSAIGYDPAFYNAAYAKLEKQVTEPTADLKIIATDISEDAVNITKVNAGIAGVETLLTYEVCDFEETTLPDAPGVVFFNPEYGDLSLIHI